MEQSLAETRNGIGGSLTGGKLYGQAARVVRQARDFSAHGVVKLVPEADRMAVYGMRSAKLTLELVEILGLGRRSALSMPGNAIRMP